MSHRTRLLAVAACVLSSGVYPPSAYAQQASDAALATELFNAGRDLMTKGDFGAACPKLAESARLDAKVGTFARLAECEEKLGKLVAARGHWQQATNLARAQSDARLAHVEAELARVDKLVPKVNVVLDTPPPAGLSLRIDGIELGAASVGVPLPVAAGPHAIVVGAFGKKPYTTSVTTAGDGAVTTVHVPALVDAPAAPIVPPPAAALAVAPARGYWTPLREGGVTAAGVGAATVVVGAVFGILAKSKLDQSNADGCVNSLCPKAGFDDRNAAYADGNVATALFIGGAVVAAAGAGVLLFSPSPKEGAPPAALHVGPGSVIVSGRF